MPKFATRTCNCGTDFQPRRQWQVYCSDACRIEAFRERSNAGKARAIEKLASIERLAGQGNGSDLFLAIRDLAAAAVEDLA